MNTDMYLFINIYLFNKYIHVFNVYKLLNVMIKENNSTDKRCKERNWKKYWSMNSRQIMPRKSKNDYSEHHIDNVDMDGLEEAL